MLRKTLSLIVAVLMLVAMAACTATDTAAPDAEISLEAKSTPSPESTPEPEEKLTVAVGIVPQAAFVEAVAGELVEVVTMVPPGNNPETFQPSMTQMMALSDAAVYFSLDLPTETASILPKLHDFNHSMQIVDLADAVAQAYPMLASAHDHHHHDDEHDDHDHDHDEDVHEEEHDEEDHDEHEEYDHHLWLSPRRVVVMVQTIADTLSALDEKNSEVYQANAQSYIAQLEALDAELTEMFSGLDNRTFIIYHAAYAYFADDYGLEMVGVEIEGKQASAADLQAVISLAREKGITTVLYQQEFDSSQARTIADDIGGTVLEVAPLSRDYMGALRSIAQALANTGD